ncbi:hypothetical protein FACS189454_05950 [Planctomycetales bacterium]|nr:hypothetical protein FACS189454_05950 [Planctomycetales bacterium]
MYLEGMGFRSIGRVLRVSNTAVLVDDQPMPGIGVTFSPVDASGKACGGATDANGNFVVTTTPLKFGTGAVAGKYNVLFTKGYSEDYGMTSEERNAFFLYKAPGYVYEIPQRYASPAKSGIEPVDVASDPKKNDFKFALTTEGLDKDNAGLATVKAKKK